MFSVAMTEVDPSPILKPTSEPDWLYFLLFKIMELLKFQTIQQSKVATEQKSEPVLKLLGVMKEKVPQFCHLLYSIF